MCVCGEMALVVGFNDQLWKFACQLFPPPPNTPVDQRAHILCPKLRGAELAMTAWLAT